MSALERYRGARVLVTGHTGFKGSWLVMLLERLGATVSGYALAPDGEPALFDVLRLAGRVARHVVADVRELAALRAALRDARPDFVFHLAAQSLVRRSYAEPLATFDVNVMGTATLLEALRLERLRCAVVVVTTDKCYENREWVWGYRESDALGGHDPYAASKAAAELVTASYRKSFFPPASLAEHGVAVATARAGNVIGGGDWAVDRIVPDAVAALAEGRAVPVRNPESTRPWQHVLDPLVGYLLLGAALASDGAASCCDAWNFGPAAEARRPVREVVEAVIAAWGSGRWEHRPAANAPHEGRLLHLAIDKATAELGYRPRPFAEAIRATVAWYRAYHDRAGRDALLELSRAQIDAFLGAA